MESWGVVGVSYGDSGFCGSPSSLINFAEGAFAIAATIDVPTLTCLPLVTADGRIIPSVWSSRYPSLVSTFLGFILVSRARGRHVKVFDCVERIDDTITLLSGIYLLLTSLIPFSIKSTLTWGRLSTFDGAYAILLFQILYILLDLVSLATLYYAKKSNLFYPIILENKAKSSTLIDISREVRLHGNEATQKKTRHRHFVALVAQLCITISINILIIPLGFINRFFALAIIMLFSTLAMKRVLVRIPYFQQWFQGELPQPLNKDRLMSFRDNMFSILATLLVLGVEIPTEGEERAYWAVHKQIFTHIVALPTAWRQLDHMVLAMTCYVPFAAIQASKSLPQGSVKGTANCPSVNTEYSGNITSGVSSDPVFVFYAMNTVIALVYVMFWLALTWKFSHFLSKDSTLVAWRPLVLAKCLVIPLASLIGLLLSVISNQKLAMAAILSVPILWVFCGRMTRKTIQRRTNTRVEKRLTMSHVGLSMGETAVDMLQAPLLTEGSHDMEGSDVTSSIDKSHGAHASA
eukprot:gene2095-5149_t